MNLFSGYLSLSLLLFFCGFRFCLLYIALARDSQLHMNGAQIWSSIRRDRIHPTQDSVHQRMERNWAEVTGYCTWLGLMLSHDVWFPPPLSAARAGVPALGTLTRTGLE